MLNQPKQKTILWVSKAVPPFIMGAHFETTTSGKTAVERWRTQNYTLTLVDTGAHNDGFTGFDVVRNIRSLSQTSMVYMMSGNTQGPEAMLAARMRVNGFISRSSNDLQNALRQCNAINWGDRPGTPNAIVPVPTISQRIMSIFKVTEKAKPVSTVSASSPKSSALALTVVDDVLMDLSSLNFDNMDESINMSNDDFIATAGLSNLAAPRDFRDVRPRSSMPTHQIRNPHGIKLQNFAKLGEDYHEMDRQFAWELYTELSTRVPVTGKANDPTCVNTEGELWIESFASLLAFCKELRVLLRTFPAHHAKGQEHLGNLLLDITRVVINPFLDKWRVDYLHWWEYNSDKKEPPLVRQNSYPKSQTMLVEWRELKMTMRAVQDTVFKMYKL